MSEDVQVERVEEWIGQEVVDPDGEKIGKLEDVFYDLDTGSPVLGAVKAGIMGRKVHVVPLSGASLGREHVRVAFASGDVKAAPAVGDDGDLSGDDEQELFSYYNLDTPAGSRSEGTRYETASARKERAAAADAARKRADDLEAQAAKKESQADSLEQRAREAEQAAQDARASAQDARRDAEEARNEAAEYGS